MPESADKASDSPLSATRWNARYARMMQWGYDQALRLKQELYEDGYPPGAMPKPDEDIWKSLIAWFDAGDPRFWSEPAQKEYKRLYEKFQGQRNPPKVEELPEFANELGG